MTKKEAIDLFGGITKLANALEMTRQAVWLWPERLPQKHTDRVTGAALREGLVNDRMRDLIARVQKIDDLRQKLAEAI